MKVKYAKWFPITAIFFGGALVIINLMLVSSGSSQPSALIPTIILPLVGILAFFNPMYVYEDGVLQARNLLGMTLFRHSRENIDIEDGKKAGEHLLFITKKNGKRKRIMSTASLLMDRKQAQKLIHSLNVQNTF